MLREIETPTADESELLPLLEQLTLEYPYVWVSSRPVGSGKRGSKVRVMMEASAATDAEAEQAIQGAMDRLLALAAGSR